MNISLFVAQLNQLLEVTDSSACMTEVCSLLSVHTFAGVTVKNASGVSVVEIMPPCGSPGGHQLCKPLFTGSIILHRPGGAFDEDEELALGIAISVCIVLFRTETASTAQELARRRTAVRHVVGTLSYSQLLAACSIAKLMRFSGGIAEGIFIASSVASLLGVAQSVITAALKKLEAANLVETRSLGMKGTFVRFADKFLYEELMKF